MEEARLQMHRVNTGGTLMPPFNAGLGFPRKSSLARLLAEERGVVYSARRVPLNLDEILRWGNMHHERTGHWPESKLRRDSGGLG